MATGYPAELLGVRDGSAVPGTKADGRVYQSRMRCIRATFDLSLASVKKAIADINVIGVIPKGHRFAGLRLTTSATLGSATLAAGYAGSAAAYKAAAVFTAVDTPTTYGKATALAAAPVEDDTEVFLTTAADVLPSSGTLVAELFYTGR